jgi:hypothetical protein
VGRACDGRRYDADVRVERSRHVLLRAERHELVCSRRILGGASNPDPGPNCNTDAGRNIESGSNRVTDAGRNIDPKRDCNTDTKRDCDTDTRSNIDPGSDRVTDAGRYGHAGRDPDTDAASKSDTFSGAHGNAGSLVRDASGFDARDLLDFAFKWCRRRDGHDPRLQFPPPTFDRVRRQR